jgi:hypothetical protein
MEKFMNRIVAFSFAVALVILSPFAARAMTDEQACQLALQFIPQEVRTAYNEVWGKPERLLDPLGELHNKWGDFHYLAFSMPADPKEYLLLAWGSGETEGGFYFRLLESGDGGAHWAVKQDSHCWYGFLGRSWYWWMQDLTKDGIPEVIAESVILGKDGGVSMNIFQWRSGSLVSITPQDGIYACPRFESALMADKLKISDVDGDDIAEVVLSPSETLQPDDEGGWIRTVVGSWEIYKYDGTSYTLWREIPNSENDPYPISVPSIAVLQPSTLPLSELSNPGNGKLKVFVSHPAGTATADDFETGQFVYDGTLLAFKKRWTNNKQPDVSAANLEWGGCPVKQAARQGNGEWQVNPSDPAMPSPDGATEYHFVGPYLELELSRSAVFPHLLKAASDAFAKEPSRETYFVEVPISGKMKNGKLAAVSAMVCIKKTGSKAPEAKPKP